MKNLIAWIAGLSVLGRIGVGIASVFTIAAVSAVAVPTTTTPEPVQPPKVEQIQEVKSTTETKNEKETKAVPYITTNQNDSSLEKGKSVVSQNGVNGKKVITYKVTYVDGVETARTVLSEEVTVKPINKVVLIGTYVYVAPTPPPATNCDPNYSGACVPIAYDVDCAGGRGNGPAYVWGPVYVIGSDIYGLDRDNDGIGCE